jgi:hypothetical protein
MTSLGPSQDGLAADVEEALVAFAFEKAEAHGNKEAITLEWVATAADGIHRD